jgi:magnesium transporter
MVAYYYRKTKHDTLHEQNSYSPGQWIQVSMPSGPEIELISEEISAEPSLLHDATDIDEMPRFEIEDDKAYMYLRHAWRAQNGTIHTAPVLLVIGKDVFLSLSAQSFPALEELLEKQPQISTVKPKILIMPVVNECLQSYASQLANIGRQIRMARNSLRDEKFSNKHFVRFVEIEDILNDFISELVPMNTILLNLLAGRRILSFSEEDRDILEDLQLEAAQLIDETKGYLKTIVNIREAYSNIMTNNLNRQIRILTTLTIVLTVPTIVGAFFGMNVDIPLDENPLAFPMVVFGTMAVALIVLFILKRKDWL